MQRVDVGEARRRRIAHAVSHPSHEAQNTLMGDHGALRLACRARGEHYVGRVQSVNGRWPWRFTHEAAQVAERKNLNPTVSGRTIFGTRFEARFGGSP